MTKYLYYSSNGLLFTPNSSYGYVPVSTILSFCCEGWRVMCAQSTLRETVGRGGFEWVRLRMCAGTMLEQDIYCANTNPKSDSQSGSCVCMGLVIQYQ